jgi:hypothetical protein
MAQNVAQPILFANINTQPQKWKKVATKFCQSSVCNFSKSKQSPNGRQFAQSGTDVMIF